MSHTSESSISIFGTNDCETLTIIPETTNYAIEPLGISGFFPLFNVVSCDAITFTDLCSYMQIFCTALGAN